MPNQKLTPTWIVLEINLYPKLEEAKKGMVSHFDNQKKEILDLINDGTRFK
ncbi:hypothetical protein BTM392_15030 [Helicobacter pylori]